MVFILTAVMIYNGNKWYKYKSDTLFKCYFNFHINWVCLRYDKKTDKYILYIARVSALTTKVKVG